MLKDAIRYPVLVLLTLALCSASSCGTGVPVGSLSPNDDVWAECIDSGVSSQLGFNVFAALTDVEIARNSGIPRAVVVSEYLDVCNLNDGCNSCVGAIVDQVYPSDAVPEFGSPFSTRVRESCIESGYFTEEEALAAIEIIQTARDNGATKQATGRLASEDCSDLQDSEKVSCYFCIDAVVDQVWSN